MTKVAARKEKFDPLSANHHCSDMFPNFQKNKVWYFMRIVCQQAILMKYHALFVIFEKAAKFEIVICCKL